MKIFNINFYLILASQIFNLFAGVLFNVALISYVYSATTSVSGATLVLVVSTLGSIIGGFIAGGFLDKISHKNVMIFSSFLSFLIMLMLSIATSVFGPNIFAIYIVTFLLNVISSFFRPARQAIVPSIIEKSLLLKANSILLSTMQVVLTSSWVVAVPIASMLGIEMSVYTISFAYLISGLLIYFIKTSYSEKGLEEKDSIINQLIKGIKPFRENKTIKSITIMDMIENLANIIWVPTFLLAFTVEVLHLNEEWWGFQGAAYFLGIIIGGLFTAKYSLKIKQLGGKVLIYASLAVAIITLVYGLNSFALLAVIYSFLIGIPSQVRNVIQESLIQEYADERVLGRVFAIRNIILQSIYIIALVAGSYLADKIGMVNIFIIGAFIYTLVALYAFMSPTIKNFNLSDKNKSSLVSVDKSNG